MPSDLSERQKKSNCPMRLKLWERWNLQMWGGRSVFIYSLELLVQDNRRTSQPPCSLWVLILYRPSLYIIIICAQDQTSSPPHPPPLLSTWARPESPG